jgi:hypothetical protein
MVYLPVFSVRIFGGWKWCFSQAATNMPDENNSTISHKTTSNKMVREVDLVSVSVFAITVQELGILRVRTYKSIVFYVMITQTMNLLDLLS